MTAPAADGRGGAPPRPAVPAAREERTQWFRFGLWVFDIQEAMQVLRAAPRPPQPLPVTLWAQAYGLIPAPGTSPHSVPLLGPGPGFDRDYAMTTDLARPVIIATVPVPDGGPPAPLLIDGYAPPVTVRSEAVAAVCRYPVTLAWVFHVSLG